MLVSIITSKGGPTPQGIVHTESACITARFNGQVVVDQDPVLTNFSTEGPSRTYHDFELEMADTDNVLEITNLPESTGPIRIHALAVSHLISKPWHTAYIDGEAIKNPTPNSWSNIENLKPGSTVVWHLDDLK